MGTNVQGNWVGTYGKDGYILGAWYGSTDLALMPQASLVVEQGGRVLDGNSTETRALENPTETERRIASLYHATQLRLRLNFTIAYSGNLHLYALDTVTTARRENVTVNDGAGPQTVALTSSFHDGAWLHFPINVPVGGSVTIVVDLTAGANAVLQAIFLGDSGLPPTAPAVPTLSATAGNASVSLSWTAPSERRLSNHQLQALPRHIQRDRDAPRDAR